MADNTDSTISVPWEALIPRTAEERERDHKLAELDREAAQILAHEQALADRYAREDAEKRAAKEEYERRLQQAADYTDHAAAADAAERRASDFEAKRSHYLLRGDKATGDARSKAFEEAYGADAKIEQWRRIATEERQLARASVEVKSEPDVYGSRAPEQRSYFADLALFSTLPDQLSYAQQQQRDQAEEALRKHSAGLRYATGGEAKRVREAVIESRRGSSKVAPNVPHILGAGSGDMLAFLVPQRVVEDSALYRLPPATFLRYGCSRRQLPDQGLKIQVPAMASAAAVDVHVMDAAVAELDPTAGLVEVDVKPYAGKITASLELMERSGGVADAQLYGQLSAQLEQKLDVAAITAALTGVTPGSRATFTVASFLSDLLKLASAIENANGVYLPVTGLFVGSIPLANFILAQLATANSIPVFPPVGAQRSEGFTGYAPGGINMYTDANIPLVGSNAQLVATSSLGTLAYVGTPIVQAYTDVAGLAGNLQGIYSLRSYACMVPRYGAAATASVSGAAYVAAPVFP